MDNGCWALQEANRQVTVMEIVSRCREIDDLDLAGVVDDLDSLRCSQPGRSLFRILEARSLIDAVPDDAETTPARDAVRDMAREHADVAKSAARFNQRETNRNPFDDLRRLKCRRTS